MALLDYSGQTTEELLALEGQYAPYALIFAFRDGLDQKFERAMGQKFREPPAAKTFDEAVADVAEGRAVRGPLSEEELIVLAIVELEAQVHNGGYDQMLHNCVYFTPMLVKALRRIGREDLAEVTQAVIDILKIGGPLTDNAALRRAIDALGEEQEEAIFELDGRFYDLIGFPGQSNLEVSLWNFIKANRDKITVGPGAPSPAKPSPSSPST